MLKSYFVSAYRNLLRNKEYSLINILGLTVSIASCLILFYVVRYELSFDAFHSNKKNIYRVVNATTYPEGVSYGEGVPAPLPKAMQTDFPQYKIATVLSVPNSQIDALSNKQGEEARFKEDRGVFFVESQFFDMFSFGWLYGSAASLKEPNVAVLTQETAEKYFGSWRNAIGKFIQFRNTNTLKVTGILENIPANSDFPFKVVISFNTRGEESDSWGDVTSRRQCFVLLDQHTNAQQLQSQLPAFLQKHYPQEGNIRDEYSLQPLNTIHFDERYGNYNGRMISKTTLLSLSLIGLFLMITASINFVNLATAQVIRKSKEVGVRKVLGSSRRQLAIQFFGETFLLLVISSSLAYALAQLALPALRPFLHLPETYNPVNVWEVILFLLGISILITLLSGFYPARIMGGFKPILALKSKISTQTVGGISLRRSLVVVQFFIAQALVIVTLVVLQQFNFFQQSPLGFNKDAIVLFSLPQDSASRSKLESLRATLLQQPKVKNVSFSFGAPLSESNRRGSFLFNNSPEQAPFEANLKYADTEFFKMYDLKLVAGRLYHSRDTISEYVVNETFMRKMGFQKPGDIIGKVITRGNRTFPIVGVVRDFHSMSLQQEKEPVMLMSNKFDYRNAGVKLETRNADNAIESIKKIYANFFPETVFDYKFLDENVEREYREEQRLSVLTKIFAGIAIAISCLGLYGLISFMTVQRKKEVAVRKVLGAGIGNILFLFYKEFIVIVLIAFAISVPVTWYFMSDWLNGFAYRISLSPWVFVLAVLLSVIIAFSTISIKTIKAALANPVSSMKNE